MKLVILPQLSISVFQMLETAQKSMRNGEMNKNLKPKRKKKRKMKNKKI